MGQVFIPKDLTKVDRRTALNLTKRQICLIFPGTAAGIGVYFLANKALGANALYLTVAIIMPFLMAALYKNRENEKLEDIVLRYLKFRLSHKTRTFKQDNVYMWIMRKENNDARKKTGRKQAY